MTIHNETNESFSGSDLLSELHERYLLLSGRFKSAWTFHQFLKGVNKVFAEQSLELGTVSFQSIYSELKVASKNLNVASAEIANRHLDRGQKELERRLEVLLNVDERLTPTLLRRFFKRVRNYDARILGQLLKFYLFTRESRWSEDRLDKADFLMTRLGDVLLERNLDPLERSPRGLEESLRGIWRVVGGEQPDDEVVADAVDRLEALQRSMSTIETLEDFHQVGSIRSYRALKKELDTVFFHPRVAQLIVEINLFLAARVEELYQREEQRVAVEYNKVFDLEREAPHLEDTLDMELRKFRIKVEDFEKSVEVQNVKIDQFVGVSEGARTLIPMLEGLGVARDLEAGAEDVEEEDVDDDALEASVEDAEEPSQSAPSVSEESAEPLPKAPALPDFFITPLGAPRGVGLDEASSESEQEDHNEIGADEEEGSASVLADNASGDPGAWRPRAIEAHEQLAAEARTQAGSEDWRAGLSAERPEETLRIRTGHADQLGDVLRQVLQVLEHTDWEQSPKLVVHVPEVRGLRLEPREVLAYRRLFFPDRFDRTVEQFLVESASLRVLIAHQAEELADFVDATDGSRTGALHEQAIETASLASEFEKRCDHFVQRAVLERRAADASVLQIIRMRLLREYSGLWLLLHR